MIYLLDTNTCIGYITRRSLSIFQRLRSKARKDIVLCDVVKFELYYGAYRSTRREANFQVIREFFEEFLSLPFDGVAAEICGRIRHELTSSGTPIGAYDLQIASIALANNLILVTHNVGEFSRVQGLQIEDWEAQS